MQLFRSLSKRCCIPKNCAAAIKWCFHFNEQECSLAAHTKYSASKLYEAYRQFCQALGRKPQSTNAVKKALEKLPNVYQHRASSGMQWNGIHPVIHLYPRTNVGNVGNVAILENSSGEILWGLFGFAYIPCTFISPL